jgi:nitrile hydratase subunit alpha
MACLGAFAKPFADRLMNSAAFAKRCQSWNKYLLRYPMKDTMSQDPQHQDSHHHHHHHSHQHEHEHDHGSDLSPAAIRVRALETILIEKGYVDPEALDLIVETYETKIGPRNGAQVVARAWVDSAYHKRLLDNATAAIAELSFSGRQGEHIKVVENTDNLHNVVVCTLCSCYPWPVLGLPPVWYKSAPYRSRVVMEPRAVLEEFGLVLPNEVRIRVWDSTAELRYLVLPQRPAGTDGWSEEKLAELVTRDSMIGTGLALSPEQIAAQQNSKGQSA